MTIKKGTAAGLLDASRRATMRVVGGHPTSKEQC
jgi:hypothetical protein